METVAGTVSSEVGGGRKYLQKEKWLTLERPEFRTMNAKKAGAGNSVDHCEEVRGDEG